MGNVRAGTAQVGHRTFGRRDSLGGHAARPGGAPGGDPFVCSGQAHRRGEGLQRAAVRRRFLSACKSLVLARLRTLTIHHGRHKFICYSLAGGWTLAEARVAAGHRNLAITKHLLAIALEADAGIGELFGFER